MQTTSGLVLDAYDDVGGSQFRGFFPNLDGVPDFVKQAQALTIEEHAALPDDAYALVLVNGTDTLRKYACIDAGNTALSVVYFLKNASLLPDVARTRCAENLKVACGWYDLAVPEALEKEAGLLGEAKGAIGAVNGVAKGLGGAALGAAAAPFHAMKAVASPLKWAANNPLGAGMAAMTLPSVVKGTAGAIKDNLAQVRAGEAMGGVRGGMIRMASANLDLMKIASAFKEAETVGTPLMPISAAGGTPTPTLAGTIKKTSSIGRLVGGHGKEQGVSPELAAPVAGEAPKSLPQHMSPVVVVTDHAARSTGKEKKASRFALPALERYPLDSYVQVKTASSYFDEFGKSFAPEQRHEYCVNLVKRAAELCIPLSDTVRKYGSEKLASSGELEAAFQIRRNLISDPQDMASLNKLASAVITVHPEDLAQHLGTFDKIAGLAQHYGHVPDPYYSVFGFQKTASDDADWSDLIGNFHITGAELKTFALNHWMKLKKTFGMEFAEEFRKDPIAIYSSMPVEQKTLIIRLATENAV